MLWNYFKIAYRNLSKNVIFSSIHILGLAIGTAACLLILQYVFFERSFDTFHEQAANIYRVPIEYSPGFSVFPKTAANHPELGPSMKADFPEVESFTRLFHPSNMGLNLAFTYESPQGQKITSTEDKVYLADSTFFDIFSFPFVKGQANNILNEPNTIVLSEAIAKKYFGDEDPIGKTLTANGRGKVTVKGVFKNIPDNSHLKFDGLLSFTTFFRDFSPNSAWLWPEFYTYVQLNPDTDVETLEAKFPAFVDRYMNEIHKEHGFQTYFSLQPLLDIHLKSDCANEPTPPGDERTVYFLSILALFILLIAWINYINLATSKSIERAREVGLRKVVGARKSQLMGQFLLEAFILNGIGLLLGLSLAKLFLPSFTQIIGTDIGTNLLDISITRNPLLFLIFLGTLLVGGFISGFYPALVLSSFRPVQVLKGYFHQTNASLSFKKVLVGFQFVLSIILIAATLLITRQLSFMNNKNLGYNKEQIVVIKAPIIRDSTVELKTGVLKSELLQYPSIAAFCKSSEVPGRLIALRSEVRKEGTAKEANASMTIQSIDDQYVNTFEIPMIAGKNFSPTDSANPFEAEINKVLINEKLVEVLGFQTPDEAIGQKILFKLGPEDRKAQIVGVMKNYHQRSLKEAYDPILYYYPSYFNWNYFSVNAKTTDWKEIINLLEDNYKQTFADNAFEFFFLDEHFDQQYQADQKFSRVSKLIALLAIFVASLGFLGLSTLIMTQRTKEIGIRKILGASATHILLLVSKNFINLLLIANFIAVPLIFYFGQKWLDNFAFNIGLGWQIFLAPIIILMLIIYLIIGVQMFRMAVLNPIHSLRNE